MTGTVTLPRVNPFFGLAYSMRRRLVEHQGRPPRDAKREPLWRLLLDEIVYLARSVFGRRRT